MFPSVRNSFKVIVSVMDGRDILRYVSCRYYKSNQQLQVLYLLFVHTLARIKPLPLVHIWQNVELREQDNQIRHTTLAGTTVVFVESRKNSTAMTSDL